MDSDTLPRATTVATPSGDVDAVVNPTGSPTESPPGAIDARVAWIAGFCLTAVVASARQILAKTPDHGYFADSISWVVLGTAAALDIAFRRIPNALTYPAILLGLLINVVMPAITALIGPNVVQSWLGGSETPRDGLLGFGSCAIFGLVSFMLRGVGGGDAKTLGAFGALLGFSRAWPALFNCLLVGAVISIVNLALRGEFIRKLQALFCSMFTAVILSRRPDHVQVFANREAPFVLSLFLGFALSRFVELHRFVFGFIG